MEVHFPPELEAKLAHSAAEQGRKPDELVRDVVSRHFEEEARFVEAVTRGEDAFKRGEYLTHEQVGQRLQRVLQPSGDQLMNPIRLAALQKKLDFLDEFIDTLDREKKAAGDSDLYRDVEELRKSSKWHGKPTAGANREPRTALALADRAEDCLFLRVLGCFSSSHTAASRITLPNSAGRISMWPINRR